MENRNHSISLRKKAQRNSYKREAGDRDTLHTFSCSLSPFKFKEIKKMLSEICLYLKNWFNFNQPKYIGDFTISNNVITFEGDMEIQANQYYRIVGSVFNDGVYKHGEETLVDESFKGAVWLMAVPPAVIQLASDIAEWQSKYGGASSEAMSPYTSESFGGYSYTKSSGSSSSGGGSSAPSWQSAFADKLRRYRKI